MPAKRRQAEWSRVMKIEDAGLWYRCESCCDRSLRKVYSSLTYKREGGLLVFCTLELCLVHTTYDDIGLDFSGDD